MTPFKFVHAADLHLDSPFQGIREVAPHIAEVLKESTFNAFTKIVDLCIHEQAAFLVISGDVYDGADRSLRAQIRFRDELARLSDAGISSYVIHGNHDPLDGWQAGLSWPDQVHEFGGGAVGREVCRMKGEDIASIYGISYAQRDVSENLSLRYTRDPKDRFAVGVLHANVGADAGHAAYSPCDLADLQAGGMDYWALGHIHTPQILNETSPAVVYAGNPQGRHPGETGPRGCRLVQVDEQGVPNPTFVEVDTVRWILEEAPVEDLETEQDLLDTLETCCDKMRSDASGRSIVCRLRLTGRSGLHRTLGKSGVISDLLDNLREQFGASEPFVWVDRIEDGTRPLIDMAVREEGEDFIGDFLRLSRQYREDSEKRGLLRENLVTLFEHRTGKKYLNTPDEDTMNDWIDEAVVLALDRMLEDE